MVSRGEACHPSCCHSDDASCVRIPSPVDSGTSRAKTTVFVVLHRYCVVRSNLTDLSSYGATLIRLYESWFCQPESFSFRCTGGNHARAFIGAWPILRRRKTN